MQMPAPRSLATCTKKLLIPVDRLYSVPSVDFRGKPVAAGHSAFEKIWHPAFGGHLAFDIRHSAFGIRHLAFGIRHLAFGIWHSAFGIRHSAFGIRHSAFGIWRNSAFGILEYRKCRMPNFKFQIFRMPNFGWFSKRVGGGMVHCNNGLPRLTSWGVIREKRTADQRRPMEQPQRPACLGWLATTSSRKIAAEIPGPSRARHSYRVSAASQSFHTGS
jgi:hypothetical protein